MQLGLEIISFELIPNFPWPWFSPDFESVSSVPSKISVCFLCQPLQDFLFSVRVCVCFGKDKIFWAFSACFVRSTQHLRRENTSRATQQRRHQKADTNTAASEHQDSQRCANRHDHISAVDQKQPSDDNKETVFWFLVCTEISFFVLTDLGWVRVGMTLCRCVRVETAAVRADRFSIEILAAYPHLVFTNCPQVANARAISTPHPHISMPVFAVELSKSPWILISARKLPILMKFDVHSNSIFTNGLCLSVCLALVCVSLFMSVCFSISLYLYLPVVQAELTDSPLFLYYSKVLP